MHGANINYRFGEGEIAQNATPLNPSLEGWRCHAAGKRNGFPQNLGLLVPATLSLGIIYPA